MREYWKTLHQHTGREIAELVETTTVTQVYGDPGGLALERTKHSSGAGGRATVPPGYIGGFTRVSATPARSNPALSMQPATGDTSDD